MVRIDIKYTGDMDEWVGGGDDFVGSLLAALNVLPKVKEFMGTGKDQVPQELRYVGWGWISPDAEDRKDPDWESPGLEWRTGPGAVQVLFQKEKERRV